MDQHQLLSAVPAQRAPEAVPLPSGWAVPPELVGSVSPIRVAASMLAKVERGCALYLAVKSRPALKPVAWPRRDNPPVPVQLVMEVLDCVEFDLQPVDSALTAVLLKHSPHDGVAAFVSEAVVAYLAASEAAQTMVPVADWWVVQHVDQGVRELWTWGRRYRSVDDAVREIRVPRLGNARARQRSEVERAVAAYTAALGRPARWPEEWEGKFAVRPREPVSRVRVADVDLVNGTRSVSFDGSVDEAAALYEQAGRPAAGQVIRGQSRRPGDCFKCRMLLSCGEVIRAPGLLGLRSYPRTRLREVSISDLRYYMDCPAQYHLRALRLPKANEYAMPARLGQAVHHYLETLHARSSEPCQDLDMPMDTGWPDSRWDLDADAAEAGLRMLAHHPVVCPIQPGTSDFAIEKTFVFHDTAAQALVAAKPDLVYRNDGAWVWRETKTTRRRRMGGDVVAEYPQVALATAILGKGLIGGPVDGARVELEILQPTGADLILIDPADPQQLAHAHSVLREMALPWREDSTFRASPGEKCRTCPVSRWCPSAAESSPPPSSQETACGADREQPA
ncbi:PD-(D/E)XK nuclease family protein [Dactylosporangium sp. NPDC051485]|uniref:PD-(D/E)XK nuclease family protein n=1 Tax=Dactylosporangium sp. NPDC051485 TaxID=3154846 RepID=UPI003420D941